MFLVCQITKIQKIQKNVKNAIALEAKPWFLGIHNATVMTTSAIFYLRALEPLEYVLVPERNRMESGSEVQFLGETA